MSRTILAVLAASSMITGFTIIAGSAAVSPDVKFRLSGWAEIPSTYRHPGPVSGQFAGPANGVTPPYDGQPIPGFSGMIPGTSPGSFIAQPDNGFGAQNNSADFLLGFYEVTPSFKTRRDGTTSRGTVAVNSFTPFSDPQGAETFAATQWRVGEITRPANAPWKYEIESAWLGPEQPAQVAETHIPGDACKPGRVYRVRTRHKDNTGRWSRWSEAVQFQPSGSK